MRSRAFQLWARLSCCFRAQATVVIFIWSFWGIMVLVALLAVATYGRNVPLAEDWLLVAPLTGNEPSLIEWLWAQNNEHRIPFPKLVLLGLLELTSGDFRAGMVFNALALGALSAALMRAVQSLRSGQAKYADAFFPAAMLHLGHWENLVWGWQLTQVLPIILTCVVLIVFARYRDLARPQAAIIASLCLLFLPLSGANGLAFTPPIALCLFGSGYYAWRSSGPQQRLSWQIALLWGASGLALALTGLYFVGYVRPSWNPPSPGIRASLIAAIQFAALSLGPTARYNWMLATVAVSFLYLVTTATVLTGAWRANRRERPRAFALLVFFGSTLAFALAIGWGRSGTIATDGIWPVRYAMMGAPALCSMYFIWELYASARLRTFLQSAAFLGFCILLPANTKQGLIWRDWYDEGMKAVEADIASGVAHTVLAERHNEFLIHWWEPSRLAEAIEMLHEARMGPFAEVHINAGEASPDE